VKPRATVSRDERRNMAAQVQRCNESTGIYSMDPSIDMGSCVVRGGESHCGPTTTPGLPRVVDSNRKAPWMVGNLTREERAG